MWIRPVGWGAGAARVVLVLEPTLPKCVVVNVAGPAHWLRAEHPGVADKGLWDARLVAACGGTALARGCKKLRNWRVFVVARANFCVRPAGVAAFLRRSRSKAHAPCERMAIVSRVQIGVALLVRLVHRRLARQR